MKSLLFRTGSGPIPVQIPPAPGSPRSSVNCGVAPQISLPRRRSIRRSASEPSVIIRSEMRTLGSRSFTTPRPPVESENCGGGMNKNRNSGGSGNGGCGGDGERNKMRDYYQEMIMSDPTNSLILRNYGRYLHQVEGDMVKAEEYYARAILASPGDGELLCLYGNFIWECYKDESRATSYFTQALQASPNDSTVLGSYAHFLWEAEEEECAEGEGILEPTLMVEAL